MSRRDRAALLDRTGMLFQNGALFDSLPVWENVCFKLLAQRMACWVVIRQVPSIKVSI